MNDSEHTHDRATTTEQIAAAGTASSGDDASQGEHLRGDTQAEQSAPATQAAAGDNLGAIEVFVDAEGVGHVDLAGEGDHDCVRLAMRQHDAAATERPFDRDLLGIAFPPVTEKVARWLYRVNQARAQLTAAAAASTSLPQLHAYQRRLTGVQPTGRSSRRSRRSAASSACTPSSS